MILSNDQAKAALTEFVQKHLPAAQALEISFASYDGLSLQLQAPLEKNINDKLTAFGGSLYMISVMTAWSSVYLKCLEHGIPNPDIVVGHAEIDYLAPVRDETIVASCTVSASDFDQFFEKFKIRGKAGVGVNARVDTEGKQAVNFSARYAIVGLT